MAMHLWAVTEAAVRKQHISARSESVGYAAGLMTWLIAGSVFVDVKLGITEMPPWTFCFWRALLASLVLVPVVARHHEEMVAFLARRWREAMFIGAIGLGLTQGVMFTALAYTSAVNTGIIFATTPMITLVLAYFFLGERMNGWQGLGSLIAFTGIVVIAVHGSVAKLLGLDIGIGDVIAFGASLMFAFYTVLLKRAKFELPPLPLLVILLGSGSLAALPFFLFELWNGEHANLAMKGYLALAYAVIIGGAGLYLLYNWSVEVLGAARAGTLLYTQMIFVAFFAWLVLGEAIEWYHYLGGGLIIIGVVLVTLLRPRPKPAAA